jgi:predicted MFS family arabinose efflux permease
MRDWLPPVAAMLAIQALMSMASVALPVLAPAAAPDIGVPVAHVGLYVALIYGAGMTCGLVSGALVRRLGALRVSQLCLLSAAAGLALTASGRLPLVVCGALLIGAGYGPVTPASSHILSRTAPAQHLSAIFSLKQTGVPLGGALAGALLPSVVLSAGWRVAALAVALACAATAVLLQRLRATLDADRVPDAPIGAGSVREPLRMVVANRSGRALSLSSFCFASLQLCLVTYLVAYLTHDLGFDLLQAGLMLAAAQGAGVVARLAAGTIADRSGRPRQVLGVMGCLMGAFALAAASFSGAWPLPAIVVVCAAFGASAIGWNGVYLAEVARQSPPGAVSAATGSALFVTYFGVLTGPPVFALMIGAGLSYGTALMTMAAPALVCGIYLIRVQAGATR